MLNDISNVSLIYNNSVYVAIISGERKMEPEAYISTSSNGIMWSVPSPMYLYDYVQDISYGSEKFILMLGYGYIAYSTDCTSWTSQYISELGNQTWKTLCYDGIKFVALSSNGYVSTSTDGTTWNEATQNSNLGNNNWEKIIYTGSKFVALSSNGYVSTSTDGTTWNEATQKTELSSYSWVSLAHNDGKLVALSLTGKIAISTNDGSSWSIENIDLENHGWSSIIYANNKYIAASTEKYISYTFASDTPDLKVTIVPNPSDALVTFSTPFSVTGNSITFPYGNYVTYTVKKDGYKTLKDARIRPTENTQLNITLPSLGYWEKVGTANRTFTKNSRLIFKYSSFYNKYIALTDNGYSSSNIIVTSDFINYTSYSGFFGELPSGQFVKINYSSGGSTSKAKVYASLMKSDFTYTDSITIFENSSTGYLSMDCYNGYLIGNTLCFLNVRNTATKTYNGYVFYTTNGTTWNSYNFYTYSNTYSMQVTPLGSNGSFLTALVSTSSGYKLFKFTGPTSKTEGNVLWSGGNMTGSRGYYDGYNFNFQDYSSYDYPKYLSTNGTSGTLYSSKSQYNYATIHQIYKSGTTYGDVFITVNRTDRDSMGIVSSDFNTLYKNVELPFECITMLGIIDNYLYVSDDENNVYKTLISNILS